MTKIDIFENLELMQTVRNNHLNPLIRRVENEIAPTVERLDHEMSETIKNVTLTESTNTLRFDKEAGGYKDIDLTPIIPEFHGIGVKDVTGTGPSIGVKLIHFPDSTVTINNPGDNVSVGFDWTSIFNHNQKWPEAVIKGTVSHMKNIIFTGDPDAAKVVGDGISLKIPKVDPLMVSIPDKGGDYVTPRPINAIEVDGEVASSSINGSKLILNLKAGGGGGTVTNQNFKGFFESLGDLQSKVDDPIHGKSFAYVKDSTLGGSYYTAYFYINNNWTELKQDPALTYFAPGVATNQGVFSIKPSDKISIDHTGQLNLDGLSTPQLPQYFVGFFDTLEQLKAEVPNPVVHQTHAYVKGPSGRGWLNYRADRQGSASLWNIVAPLGSFSFVDEKAASFTQVFGIKKSDAWELDSQGLLTMKGGGAGPGGVLNVGVSGYNNQFEVHDVKGISFNRGKSFAEFTGTNKDHVLIDHPQRIINYNSTFEAAHNSQDYEGNIFYDETSRCWMGWGIPDAPGGVDAKWTRIAHPKMSDDVKGLMRRLPAKTTSVEPGVVGDNRAWDYNGVSFLEKDSDQLPAELINVCGGYINTFVQDKDAAGITIPQFRMQQLTADRENGGTWVRRFVTTGSAGSQTYWSDWVRTSFERSDMNRHEKDPNAHKDVVKFHTVFSLKGLVSDLQNQEYQGVMGAIREGNKGLLANNYGTADLTLDYASIPYDGSFKGSGVIEFSGYNGTTSALGKWTIKVRILKKGEAVAKDLYEGYYTHTNQQERFPPLRFEIPKYNAVLGDQLSLHVIFDNPTSLKTRAPLLYIAPIKSYAVLEDSSTKVGCQIGETFREALGRVDFSGDVGVRVHHNEFDVKRNVRVYGVISNKDPVELNKVLNP